MLIDLIVDEIDRAGPLSFSRYMELALYHPELGFYADGGAGRRRDFITSPEVGPLYGAVVARAIDAWWDQLGQPDDFTFVEVGAGPGTLARSVLRCELRCRASLTYVAVETSAAQRAAHPDDVTSVVTLPARVADGVIFANELLDNLPFDVLSFLPDHGWREVRVSHRAGELREELVPAGPPDLAAAESDQRSGGEIRIPVQAAAQAWLRSATSALARGRVVVVDYAVPRYPTEPGRDWLRTYSAHGRGGDPLLDPGTKDITADVDLAWLHSVSPPNATTSQAAWLHLHGIAELIDAGTWYWEQHAAAPDLRAIEMRSRATEAQALLDPGGLGGFTVGEWSAVGS